MKEDSGFLPFFFIIAHFGEWGCVVVVVFGGGWWRMNCVCVNVTLNSLELLLAEKKSIFYGRKIRKLFQEQNAKKRTIKKNHDGAAP